MTDFASKTRLYGTARGYKGRFFEPTGQVAASARDLRQDEWWFSGCVSNAAIASSSSSHSCQSTILEDYRNLHLFESVIMTNCMRKINNELVTNYRQKTVEEKILEENAPFLFEVGRRGSGEGELLFPRSVSCCLTGDIVVADCENDRIQVYNGYGIWKDTVAGTYLKRPSLVAMSACPSAPKLAAVADDSTNVHIVDIETLKLVSQVAVGYRPSAIGWTTSGYLLCAAPADVAMTVPVSSTSGSSTISPTSIVIDVFGVSRHKSSSSSSSKSAGSNNNKTSKRLRLSVDAPFPSRRRKPLMPILQPFFGDGYCFMLGVRHNECVACVDIRTRQVRFRCQLKSPFDGLAVDMADFSMDPERPDHFLAADQCNRFLLSCHINFAATTRAETVISTAVVARPRDGIGQLRRCAVSPWGHAISCEYGQDLESMQELAKSRDKTTMSAHRLTVFRYRKCECHDWQPAKQHRMDATSATPLDPTKMGTKEVRRAIPVWMRTRMEESEQRYLSEDPPDITPDPRTPTPEPITLTIASGMTGEADILMTTEDQDQEDGEEGGGGGGEEVTTTAAPSQYETTPAVTTTPFTATTPFAMPSLAVVEEAEGDTAVADDDEQQPAEDEITEQPPPQMQPQTNLLNREDTTSAVDSGIGGVTREATAASIATTAGVMMATTTADNGGGDDTAVTTTPISGTTMTAADNVSASAATPIAIARLSIESTGNGKTVIIIDPPAAAPVKANNSATPPTTPGQPTRDGNNTATPSGFQTKSTSTNNNNNNNGK